MSRPLPPEPIARHEICAQIRAAPAATVVLRAAAGAGKSVLLRQLGAALAVPVCDGAAPRPEAIRGGWLLWDVPHARRSVRLAPAAADAAARLVIACRPGQRIEGLARRQLYSGSLALGDADLALSAAELARLPAGTARRMAQDFAAWPAFLPLAAAPDERLLCRFLRESFLRDLPPAALLALADGDARDGADDAAGPLGLPAFLIPGRAPPLLARLCAAATRAELDRRRRGKGALAVAAALESRGRALEAIDLLLARGLEPEAAAVLARAEGFQLIYQSRLQDFQHTILRFSPEMMARDETVLFAVCRTLLKQGEMQRVRNLAAKHLGRDYLDPLKVLPASSGYSFAARSFRLNLMIGEDLTPSDAMLARLGEFMAEYPVGEYARWASFYNAVLEFEIRRRNFREAEAAAARALIYLDRMGGQPLLEFFIHLHQCVLRLMQGDAHEAGAAAVLARARLDGAPQAAANEYRMLRLLEACLACESGRSADLLAFVQDEFAAFTAAEIWPSLMQCALHYASQALADHHPTLLRPGFLDGLWLHLSERLQFHAMMEIRAAIAYQNANRWAEAETILTALRMPKGRNWIETAEDDLTRLNRRDEIAYAMAWLRSALHLRHPRPHLDRQLTALAANPRVTNRERAALALWQAYAAQQRRDPAMARAHLVAALLSISRLGCHAVLSEERIFLAPLLADRRLRRHVEAAGDLGATLALFAQAQDSPRARARREGLSLREVQALELLASGLTNKWIARTLELSEVTVKFHLGNLYRKLGCRNRAGAIAAAGARGWL